MDDVVVVGAGPAGSVAATVLARAGVRVRLVDRASFPRGKLCGDTLNPGTLSTLGRLGLAQVVDRGGLELHGMLVTGEGRVSIAGRYPRGLHGRSITRRLLDGALLQEALRAGASFEAGVTVRGAVADEGRVGGVTIGSNGSGRPLRARITIAADGRHSTVAFGLGVARHPVRPRRWAIGAYFENVSGTVDAGEMHIRSDRYIGVAPLPDGVVNVCLVLASGAADGRLRNPAEALRHALAADRMLRERFADARLVSDVTVLGPLAVDVPSPRTVPDGLLLAGDAGGFIDPMTGDGLRFAIRGGELAALAALGALGHGWRGVQAGLVATRNQEFAAKWRFNRALRALVASPLAVRAAATGARLAPGLVRALIAKAGDCDLV
jgi:geranylgeranyl reductase family protein